MDTSPYRYDANAQSDVASGGRAGRFLRPLFAAAALLTWTVAAKADLAVDVNLGALPAGNYALVGTTVGGPNNADIYDIVNPNLFWVEERVYQFTVGGASRISLLSDDPNGAPPGIDNDFFLSDTLATTISGTKDVGSAIGFVEVQGTLGIVPAGLYYIFIDAFRGGSLANPTGAGPFNAVLTIEDLVAPVATQAFVGGSITSFLEPGEIEWYTFDHVGGPFTVDTVGSNLLPDNDSELFLYSETGLLLAANDDAAGLNLLSRISVADLPAGQYYLAAGGYNSFGSDGWSVDSGSPETGTLVINGLSPIPEPSTAVLGALGSVLALVVARRRRR